MTHLLYQQHPLPGPRGQISGCGGILMTGSHGWRCWNTLYMYEEDLLWVWREWGVSIISTNRHLPPINNIHSSSPNSSYKAGSASLWPLATVTGAEIHYIYMYEVDLLGGLNHNLTWKHLHNLLLLRLSPESESESESTTTTTISLIIREYTSA